MNGRREMVQQMKGQLLLQQILEIQRVASISFMLQGQRDDEQLLYDCIKDTCRTACKYNLKSVSIPAISSGIFGFPRELCAAHLFRAVEDFCFENRPEILVDSIPTLRFVRFTNFDYPTVEEFQKQFNQRYNKRQQCIPFTGTLNQGYQNNLEQSNSASRKSYCQQDFPINDEMINKVKSHKKEVQDQETQTLLSYDEVEMRIENQIRNQIKKELEAQYFQKYQDLVANWDYERQQLLERDQNFQNYNQSQNSHFNQNYQSSGNGQHYDQQLRNNHQTNYQNQWHSGYDPSQNSNGNMSQQYMNSNQNYQQYNQNYSNYQNSTNSNHQYSRHSQGNDLDRQRGKYN
ncbi:UNKNOWN [Stylonychia lemnae]|uniref:Macro domain-containing protein n=1 Tax=Stylonychia lemnae TaxID=5949 RepID=A0A078BC78_STYLE|nr:UNKNOWN [Stylonychia lemnae]|eukprot:CDW90847.1 UNKNOWN [Stylonychia lemnae]